MTITVRNVRKTYDGREILRGVDLDVAPGEIVALLGRSGSGKSTLLRILGGLEGAEGEIDVPREVGFGFQDASLLPWMPVWKNVLLGMDPRERARAERILDAVHLAGRADAWPLTLSGGEAQRVSLARALVREPELLLLDEPFGALDALTRRAMHALLRELHEKYRPSILMVTHDVDEAIALADRILVIGDGRILAEEPAGTPREVLFGHLGV
ncbi:aliphatic sulfonate ABC transporter ATP-binding protein [Microbacterium sorbitolivorans]|uniref:ABC transporter ATP-binding protein n=1 Tax=Microbacterium sorbitolivorans TaxID=1867410 RepID=A0A367XTC5_9MICO|nr:ABC transporter ATP-binding protein [Microbacterium sorbitolivorans]RCK56824.1 ABC transporter ATP-binding protein [Microbacterium sorbitolivorans]GGF49040.1 aliphatic sulfonate ABC transporter ATP-binding protein [Microbacterium sorbitolivorans]